MKIVFRSYFHNITFKHYLDQPKPMIETNLNKKLCNNPELIEVLTQIHTPRSCVIGKVLIFYIFPISYILFSYSIHTCKQ